MTQTVLLGDISSYVTEKVSVNDVALADYVSTENLIADKGGLSPANNLPQTGKITKFQKDDVLVSNIRPYFKKIWQANRNGGASNDVLVFRPKNQSLSHNYLYYVLKNDRFFDYSTASSSGSKMPRGDKSQIMKYPIYLPDLETQKNIADVLGTIDEKIELNRRMNVTLEQIGQALFRHYFIDNPEAEKWEDGQVSDFANHSKKSINPVKNPTTQYNQYSIPAFDNSMSPESTIGGNIKSNKYGVMDWSILVSKLNPATPRIWPVVSAKEEAICSTEFQVIVPHKYYAFVYFLLTSREYSDKMSMMTSGTSNSHRRISPADILNYSFKKPSEDLLHEFEAKAKVYIRKVDGNRHQIQTLTALRDTLLPRLINGKIAL